MPDPEVTYPELSTPEDIVVCEQVSRLLGKFESAGSSLGEMAQLMHDHGVLGIRGNGYFCAVAEYLNDHIEESGYVVSVSGAGAVLVHHGKRGDDGESVRVDSHGVGKIGKSEAREQFVSAFDTGMFPSITRSGPTTSGSTSSASLVDAVKTIFP